MSRRPSQAGLSRPRGFKKAGRAKANTRKAAELPRPHLEHETRLLGAGVGIRWVAGIDEAGRGPLAGPVVAAAVVLPPYFVHAVLNDSKILLPAVREALYAELTGNPAVFWACAIVEPPEIDRLNILRATHEAMRRAFAALPVRPEHVLIDGRPVHPFPVEHTALIHGDAISLSIAAASVIAKVTRDRLMVAFDARYPAYGFARHKGYATPEHLAILARDGPCPIHRFSFSPVAQPSFPFVARRRRPRPTAIAGAQG